MFLVEMPVFKPEMPPAANLEAFLFPEAGGDS